MASEHRERGVALCGSGVGASIAANKVPGVRARLIHRRVLRPVRVSKITT
jgi:ribose 5-phosphate isomerase B